ncbi:hypothetical protein [Rhizobium laguerreae]|uniref:Prokaryotic glutathione synthetase ATP-binding domain-containing protein n=1 Tax=Rhizobium laguerreae TaxID=1076926 RepID=A0A6N9ZN73_9HYPH|nr:hypothetical protein [Rhizobium laguerreae]NEH94751.1 hypothetical protein [Rhizobium laguerreae]
MTEFADLMPKTLITKDSVEIRHFRDEMGDIILKPLYGNGGAGISIRPATTASSRRSAGDVRPAFPRALPDVRKGDKRILLVNGEFAGVAI